MSLHPNRLFLFATVLHRQHHRFVACLNHLPRHPLPLELHVNVPAMGRVALREGGRTVAVGVVEGIEE